jgi:hypothetical protein
MKRRAVLCYLLLGASLPASGAAWADDAALWALSQGGKQVVLLRHAATTAGAGDPPGFARSFADSSGLPRAATCSLVGRLARS